MNQIEYLLFNSFIFGSSSLAIAMTKGAVFPRMTSFFKALVLVSLPYVIWDYWVTNWWWSFNPRYVLGAYFGPLPLEEILFFIVIPWSCLSIWVNLKQFIHGEVKLNLERYVAMLGLCGLVVSWLSAWWYTLAVSLCLLVSAWISTQLHQWLRQRSSLVFLGLTFLLILIFNGYLTARPVVRYSLDVRTQLNLVTIPIEDVIYGLVLVGATAMVYDFFEKRRLRESVAT